MSLKFYKLTRASVKKLQPGETIIEEGIIYKRLANGDGRYTVNVMVNGERIHRVIGKESEGTTLTQVLEYLEKVKTEAREQRLKLPKGRKLAFSFRDASSKYMARLKESGGKDLKSKHHRLRDHLVPFFGDKPLSNITTFDVERYKKSRLETSATPGTINREFAVLSHMLNKSLEWGWLEHKPCVIKRLKENNERITYLTAEQINRLLEAAKQDLNPHIYLFILIGLETAMRRMEILSIQIKNIDVVKQTIFIPDSKTGAREQPMTPRLAQHLKKLLKELSPEQKWLFPSSTSKTGYILWIERPFREVVVAAGLDPKEVIRHTLRHTAITHLVQAGVDLPTVKRFSGHKTLQMVERYSHQNGAHIRAAMEKLEQQYSLSPERPSV